MTNMYIPIRVDPRESSHYAWLTNCLPCAAMSLMTCIACIQRNCSKWLQNLCSGESRIRTSQLVLLWFPPVSEQWSAHGLMWSTGPLNPTIRIAHSSTCDSSFIDIEWYYVFTIIGAAIYKIFFYYTASPNNWHAVSIATTAHVSVCLCHSSFTIRLSEAKILVYGHLGYLIITLSQTSG